MGPNPYSLLSCLPPESTVYMVLDLKNTSFSLPLAAANQSLFAFEWHDPELGFNRQLTWTTLLQGSKNSPTIYDEVLHEDLHEYRHTHPSVSLLDTLFVATPDVETCHQATTDLLQERA